MGEVIPDTPAARAGLRAGDRIVQLDGQPIRSRNDLMDRLDRIPARSTITLGVVREGDSTSPRFMSVRTASRPSSDPAATRTAPSEPRPSRASVPVTPTSSNVEPAESGTTPAGPKPTPPPSAGSNPSSSPPSGSSPSPPPSGETHPGPSATTVPSSTRIQDAPAPAAPVPAAPDRVDPAAAAPPALNELKLTLPRAVERIEQLERRIQELEQFRDGPPLPRERDARAQPDVAKGPARRRP